MILSLLLATLAQSAPTAPPAPPPAGRMMDLRAADADGDGIVTRQEALARGDAMFARMDANHDGTVTADERRTALAAMANAGSRPDGGRAGRGGMAGRDLTLAGMRDMAGRRFDRMDANGDGRLDAAELAAAHAPGGRSDR